MIQDARRPFRNIEHLEEPAILPVQDYATVVEEAAVSRMGAFPEDDGRDGFENRMRFILPNLSPYAMRDLIVDLRSGEVPAFVRRRDLSGLRSLAFCDASLRLRRSEAIVGR